MFGARRGLPWWGAILLALVTAIAGAVLNTQVGDGLGLPFQLIYGAGALVAVAAARRRNLFGPMVQPPLVMAVTVPLVVLTGTSLPESNDMLANVLAVSTPLINNFPVMAITTALTIALGVFRIHRERDPDRPAKNGSQRKRTRDDEDDGDRPAAAKDKRPPRDKRPSGDKRPSKDKPGSTGDKVKGETAAGADGPAPPAAGAAGARRPASDSGTSGRRRRPHPPEDRPDAPPGRGEPPRRSRPPADGPPGRGPRGPGEGPPPRRPGPADEGRGTRTPPPDRRPPRTPPEDPAREPKRPQRPPRGERPDPPPQRPKRPREAEPPPERPRRDQPRRRPWDTED
ncbi:hypothetical protein LY41_001805 [Prauserella halophila]|nr:hypothetical protein [Prauserella halophila]